MKKRISALSICIILVLNMALLLVPATVNAASPDVSTALNVLQKLSLLGKNHPLELKSAAAQALEDEVDISAYEESIRVLNFLFTEAKLAKCTSQSVTAYKAAMANAVAVIAQAGLPYEDYEEAMSNLLDAAFALERTDNIAINAQAYADSYKPSHEPSKAVDADESTAWYSGAMTDPETSYFSSWLMLEFNAPVTVEEINISWVENHNASFNFGYIIESSADGENWKQILATEIFPDSLVLLTPVTAKFFRINCDYPQKDGIAINEFRVYPGNIDKESLMRSIEIIKIAFNEDILEMLTDSSREMLLDVISAAEDVLADEDTTQFDIQAAFDLLNDVLFELEMKTFVCPEGTGLVVSDYDMYLVGINAGQTPADFPGYAFYNDDNEILADNALIGTGCVAEYEQFYVEVAVLGDVDGNGIINNTDALRVRKAYLQTYELYGAALAAANVDGSVDNENGEATINNTDALRVRKAYLGTYALTFNPDNFIPAF